MFFVQIRLQRTDHAAYEYNNNNEMINTQKSTNATYAKQTNQSLSKTRIHKQIKMKINWHKMSADNISFENK